MGLLFLSFVKLLSARNDLSLAHKAAKHEAKIVSNFKNTINYSKNKLE
jgi:hypothetical protein